MLNQISVLLVTVTVGSGYLGMIDVFPNHLSSHKMGAELSQSKTQLLVQENPENAPPHRGSGRCSQVC